MICTVFKGSIRVCYIHRLCNQPQVDGHFYCFWLLPIRAAVYISVHTLYVCMCVCASVCIKATYRGHMLWDFPLSGNNLAHVLKTVSLGMATRNDPEPLIRGTTIPLASSSDYIPETLEENWGGLGHLLYNHFDTNRILKGLGTNSWAGGAYKYFWSPIFLWFVN